MTRTNCHTCDKKIKGNKFECCFCDKVMHFTPECTELDKNSIEVLIKLEENLLLICNKCKSKKANFNANKDSEQANKVDEKLLKLEKQVEALTSKVEESHDCIKKVENNVHQIKMPEIKSFKQALGNVVPGKIVSSATSPNLGILIRGLPEEPTEPPDKRVHMDLARVDELLTYLEVPDRKLTRATRLGKVDSEKKAPRTLLINTENPISKDLILKSAHRLKEYKVYDNPIYIMAELNASDAKIHNECLRKRRELIDDKENGLTSMQIRVRNLKVEVLKGKKWSAITDNEKAAEKNGSED